MATLVLTNNWVTVTVALVTNQETFNTYRTYSIGAVKLEMGP